MSRMIFASSYTGKQAIKMSNVIDSSRRLATIGSALLILPALNIVGIILVLMGMRGLAKHYNNKRISHNALVGTIFGIISFIEITLYALSLLIITFAPHILYTGQNGAANHTITIIPTPYILISCTCMFLMALFFKRAFNTLSSCSGEPLLRTATKLLLIGAIVPLLCTGATFVLNQIFLIKMNTGLALITGLYTGLIITDTAFVLMTITFYSLKSTQIDT
jgi:uncharacterized membrane protein